MSIMRAHIEAYETLKAMNTIVKNMNDEMAYGDWINIVPDEATDDDLISIAEDDDLMDDCTKLFCDLIKRYGEGGFYFG